MSIKHDFIKFVKNQPADMAIQNQDECGITSWKCCAVGRFISEELHSQYLDSRFDHLKTELLNSLPNITQVFLGCGTFKTYGELQEHLK